jgi:asparagine synthase (glutamine-hydrolysing)
MYANKPVEIESLCKSVVRALGESVKRNPSDGLLLSGGLDTAILVALAAKYRKPDCVTVALKRTPGPDIEYAQQLARLFGLKHVVHYIDDEEMQEGLRQAIKILKCFDPMEIRNSAAAYLGLRVCRDMGLKAVMTGDGGDELFAGYSFYFDLSKEQLDAELKKMWAVMRFSSIPLAEALGIKVKLPMLDPEFKTFAMNMDAGWKVRKERGQIYGKWILRKAFAEYLPDSILWRPKAPLEVGTGTATLPAYYEALIPDTEFQQKQAAVLARDRVNLRNKEQLAYYEIYRDFYEAPDSHTVAGRKCPDCGGHVMEKATYCPTCGAYPV